MSRSINFLRELPLMRLAQALLTLATGGTGLLIVFSNLTVLHPFQVHPARSEYGHHVSGQQVAGTGHSVAVRGSGGYLRQMGQISPAVTASCLKGTFTTQKSLQFEFFIAATTKVSKIPPFVFLPGMKGPL
ncbi:MAG: hypothetical protein HC875_41425 [Anaerolineales bacterium]|nr:hypothetical protein [Anaerolineales bacterium]